MYRTIGVVVLSGVLAGCQLTRSDELRADADACRSYGFKDGTPELANCRMQQDTQRRAIVGDYLARRAAEPPAYQVVQPPVLQTPTRQPVNCTSMAIGTGMVSTSCN
jgi:hypothetical protein